MMRSRPFFILAAIMSYHFVSLSYLFRGPGGRGGVEGDLSGVGGSGGGAGERVLVRGLTFEYFLSNLIKDDLDDDRRRDRRPTRQQLEKVLALKRLQRKIEFDKKYCLTYCTMTPRRKTTTTKLILAN